MIFLYNFRKNLSLISISVLSALIHNFIQLIVVYFLMFTEKHEYPLKIYNVFYSGISFFRVCCQGHTVIGEKLLLRRSCER